MTVVEQAKRSFEDNFGAAPERVYYAPGRVNLIGEHTDYNDGFVLPCALQYGTVVAATPRDDGIISVFSLDYGNQQTQFETTLPIPMDDSAPWSNYVRGVVHVLLKDGHTIGGANLLITGTVPKEVGLSSSASLEVALVTAMTDLNQLPLDAKAAALMGQRAERDYVGCNCGIMDQFISALGRENHAVLIDCRSLETKDVPISPELSVVVIHSNVKRSLVDSEYNERRAQCETAAKALKISALRDATLEQLDEAQSALDPVVYRRARHVITENERTLAAADALANNQLTRLGELMAASHRSLRYDFEVTVPAIDALVQIVSDALDGHGGVRMTGGGFGGCIVAVTPTEHVPAIEAAVENLYEETTGNRADIFICRAAAGASVIS